MTYTSPVSTAPDVFGRMFDRREEGSTYTTPALPPTGEEIRALTRTVGQLAYGVTLLLERLNTPEAEATSRLTLIGLHYAKELP